MPRRAKSKLSVRKKSAKKNVKPDNLQTNTANNPISVSVSSNSQSQQLLLSISTQADLASRSTVEDNGKNNTQERMQNFIQKIDAVDAAAAGPSTAIDKDAAYGHPNCNKIVRVQADEHVIYVDDTSDVEENIPSVVFTQEEHIAEMILDFSHHLEQERQQKMEDARLRAAAERHFLEDAIEQGRQRNNQLTSYLLAGTINDDYDTYSLGIFNNICQHCAALYFTCERNTRGHYTSCCSNGQVILPPLAVTPSLLKRLYIGEHHLARHFRKNIIRYNYAFQFASTEANIRQFSNRGPYVYAIQGKVYHHISHVDINNTQPRYAQMYFLDTDEGVQRRHAGSEDTLCRELIQELELLLRSVNPYAIGFLHLRERYTLETELQVAQNLQMPNLVLEFVHIHGRENRTSVAPTVREVAIIHNAEDELPPAKNLRIFLRDRPHRFVEILYKNPLSDPLSFPLLFAMGEQGWHDNIFRTNNRTKVSLADYYSYRFAYRTMPQERFQIFQQSGKLFQQFVVASYIKIESSRLEYITQNQNKMRSELYNGLADFLQQHANQNHVRLGRMVILPSTYIGGPRNMMELFQDSLAIVQKLGQPSLFITFTCNPKWPDIINNIPAGDEPSNHPLLVARVFKSMLKELLDDLDNKQIMGVSIGRVYVIEFQKRGLPHAHLLVILRSQDRMEEAFRIDALIRAELPDVCTEPRLYNLICTHNMHGPCYTNSVCMVNGRCSKHFPKLFAEETSINEKGFVIYKRRDDGRVAIIARNNRQFQLDNRWVVPYNSYLTLKYSCHINVEACPSTRAIKYLYKYIWKGVDKCLIRLRADDDQIEYNEINAYVSARYLAPPEASWRILKFPLHDNTHAVIRLPVHLPHQQNVIFQETDIEGAMYRYTHTHLTRWFELNANDVDARQFLYTEIPMHYVWNKANRNWSRRQRYSHNIVTRMYAVSPRQGELYYLRLLLLHVRGPSHWEDIRTVDGQVCTNFREACCKMNLLLEDSEWIRCLEEAQQTRMAYQIRQLFACILIFCEVGNPLILWERFCDCMIDDFLHADENLQREAALQMALVDLEKALCVHNKRLAEYNLPQPQVNLLLYEDIDIVAEQYEAAVNSARLNCEQRSVYDVILRSVHRNRLQILPPSERLFVVDSAGGTGKSFLLNTLISRLAGEEIAVLSCCFTGIGATILKRGKTIHSAFKLRLNPDECTTSGVRPNSVLGRFMVGVSLIIIDEISMVSRVIFNIIDRTLRDVTGNDAYFGGKVVLLGGDFRQLLPVIEHANRPVIVSQCIKNCALWSLFTRCVLSTNLRTLPEEIEFREWLLQLGNGTLTTVMKNNVTNLILIPSVCVVETKERLIDICFEGIMANEYTNVAILTPKNEDCDYINEQVLNMIHGEQKTYQSADVLDEQDEEALAANYTTEYLNTLKPSGFPQYALHLKVGTVVLLLRNLNIKKNLCNGTKLIIKDLKNNYIAAERLESGNLTGDIVFIPRIDFSTSGSTFPVSFKRRQFPLRLAYSMTINKSQGQTLQKVGIYLPKPVFTHGALYVAASRAKSFDHLHIYVEEGNEQGTITNRQGVYTKNIVFHEVLQ